MVRLVLGLSLVVFLAASGWIDWISLESLVLEWRRSLSALALMCLAVLLVSWRLCILLAVQGLTLTLRQSFRLSLIGAFFNVFLPGSYGGDVARIYLAARHNAGLRTEIATTVVFDRALGLFSLVALPLLIGLLAPRSIASSPIGMPVFAAGALALALAGGALVIAADPEAGIRRVMTGLARPLRLEFTLRRILDALHAYRRYGRAVLGALVLSLLIQCAVVGAIALLVRGGGASEFPMHILPLIPLGMLANALPLTPGGIGVGEAAFETLFRSVGVEGGAEAILAWRLLTTLIDLCGGALLLFGHTEMAMVRRMSAPISSLDVDPIED